MKIDACSIYLTAQRFWIGGPLHRGATLTQAHRMGIDSVDPSQSIAFELDRQASAW